MARAIDSLDAFALRVLEAIALFDNASVEVVFGAFGGPDAADPVTGTAVAEAFERLFDRALIWGDPARPHLAGPVLDLLGPFPAGLGQPAEDLLTNAPTTALAPVLAALGLEPAIQPDAGEAVARVLADDGLLEKLVAERSEPAQALLHRLAAGPPIGTLPGFGSSPRPGDTQSVDDAAAAELIMHGLLVPIGPAAVELPREVGALLRRPNLLGAVSPQPPALFPARREPAAIDDTATVAVLELLRLVDALVTAWSDDPPGQLRSGGLGVRDLRRTARDLGIDEAYTGLLLEVANAADLISAPTAPDVPWLPTTDYDSWAPRDPSVRWVRLAQAWRTMTRQPHLIGERDDRGKTRAALSYEVERSAAPALRAEILHVLATSPEGGIGPAEDVLTYLAWRMPRRARAQRAAAAAVLAEAELLGFTGGGGLTSFGRAILAGSPGEAANLLSAAMPAPVAEFLLQPDLTLVVPGPPTAGLAREVALVADLESAGGASVYRITETSLRRALDAGRTAADIHALFASRSRTPVPQALAYLVDDLVRRYGVLRSGSATSYLRCEDTALLDRVLGDRATAALGWHRVAPTVVLSTAPAKRVLEVLREAGYAPAAENADGLTVTAGDTPPRARPRRPESARNVPSASLREEQFADAIRRMRLGDEMSRTAHKVTVSQDIPGVTSASTLGVLRQAIRGDQRVWVAYVDTAGTAITKIIAPLSLGGGFLRGHDDDSGDFRSIPLHRITEVNVLESS